MSKIKHIHLYRNGTVLGDRNLAVTRLKDFLKGNDNLDGVAILARYKSANNGVQTLVGFVYGGDGTNSKSITIFDNEGSKSDTNTEINNLRKEIETQINNTLTSANTHTNEEIAKLSIAYDSSTRKLQLKGNGGNLINEIDATAFVKDGMLNDTAVFTASATTQSITFGEKETITDPVPTGPVARVVPNSSNTHEYSGLTINHHYLAFEFKIDNDAEQPYKYEILDATDIIDVYKNGNGLELTDDHTFSVKKADDSEGFLTIDENGVKISGVTDAIAAAAASAKTEVKKATDDQHIDVTSAATEGHVTYTISSVDTASATELTNVKNNVGLGAGGNHIQTSGNYTSSATTVTGEIAALDTQVKKNETSITTLNSQVNEINGKIVKNAPKGSDAITVTEAADGGSTIAIKLSATNSGLKIDESGLAIDFETLELDCGTY